MKKREFWKELQACRFVNMDIPPLALCLKSNMYFRYISPYDVEMYHGAPGGAPLYAANPPRNGGKSWC